MDACIGRYVQEPAKADHDSQQASVQRADGRDVDTLSSAPVHQSVVGLNRSAIGLDLGTDLRDNHQQNPALRYRVSPSLASSVLVQPQPAKHSAVTDCLRVSTLWVDVPVQSREAGSYVPDMPRRTARPCARRSCTGCGVRPHGASAALGPPVLASRAHGAGSGTRRVRTARRETSARSVTWCLTAVHGSSVLAALSRLSAADDRASAVDRWRTPGTQEWSFTALPRKG